MCCSFDLVGLFGILIGKVCYIFKKNQIWFGWYGLLGLDSYVLLVRFSLVDLVWQILFVRLHLLNPSLIAFSWFIK